MVLTELKVHRFKDCSDPTSGEREPHRLTSLDMSRITCEDCKRRIIQVIAKRDWGKLISVEMEALEIAAAEASE